MQQAGFIMTRFMLNLRKCILHGHAQQPSTARCLTRVLSDGMSTFIPHVRQGPDLTSTAVRTVSKMLVTSEGSGDIAIHTFASASVTLGLTMVKEIRASLLENLSSVLNSLICINLVEDPEDRFRRNEVHIYMH